MENMVNDCDYVSFLEDRYLDTSVDSPPQTPQPPTITSTIPGLGEDTTCAWCLSDFGSIIATASKGEDPTTDLAAMVWFCLGCRKGLHMGCMARASKYTPLCDIKSSFKGVKKTLSCPSCRKIYVTVLNANCDDHGQYIRPLDNKVYTKYPVWDPAAVTTKYNLELLMLNQRAAAEQGEKVSGIPAELASGFFC
jgi:hypothetical protein